MAKTFALSSSRIWGHICRMSCPHGARPKQHKSKIPWLWILTHRKPLTVWHYGVKWKTLSGDETNDSLRLRTPSDLSGSALAGQLRTMGCKECISSTHGPGHYWRINMFTPSLFPLEAIHLIWPSRYTERLHYRIQMLSLKLFWSQMNSSNPKFNSGYKWQLSKIEDKRHLFM